MCGITGYIATEELDIKQMLYVLNHRGPDHHSYYTDYYNNQSITIGHTRLSILDLSSNGNQPMFIDDKHIAIVFNGEIYNFEQLKNQYLNNELFHSKTDTEVVLKLYAKLGIDFINKLHGDFAMCIYDKRMKKLFIIRDYVGVKPLYYYFNGSKFIFASEIKGIIASGIKPELNIDELQNYFVFKYTPQNNTLFKHIKRVPPASYIEFDLNTSKIKAINYWTLNKKSTYSDLSYNDAKDVLYNLVEKNVTSRLIADVPIGNFLSGGVDSSIIAYFIKNRKDIQHYCAKKNENDLRKEGTTSDFYYAQKLANEWKLNLLESPIGNEEANTELIKRTLYYSDDLIADGSQIPSYMITKNASQSSKVILSGMGADELFLGYAGHQLTLLSNSILSSLPNTIGNLICKQAARVNQGKGKFLAYRRYIHKIGKYGMYPKYKYGIFNLVGDYENSCAVYNYNKTALEDKLTHYFPEDQNVFDSLFKFELENVLVKNLHYTDRTAMANSIECRVPFLDKDIIEFAYNIPRNYKLSNTGKSKIILKDTFKNYLPDYIVNRRKAGFGMPLRSIFSSKEKVYQLLDKQFFLSFDNFNLKHIEIIIDNHIAGKEDNSSIIYALISFQEWYKLNF